MSEHDLIVSQAEEALVALALETPSVAAQADVSPEKFRSPLCRAAWSSLLTLSLSGRPVDAITVAEEAGVDPAKLSRLLVSFPSPSAMPEYKRIVESDALRRKAMEALADAINEARDGKPGEEVVAGIQSAMAGLSSSTGAAGRSVREVLKETSLEFVERMDGSKLWGIPSGVDAFDEKIGGFPFGVVSTIAARPSVGKSSFGIATADAVTASGRGAHVFTMEDTATTYGQRLICRGGVDSRRLRAMQLTRGELDAADAAMRSLAERKWIVDDRSGLSAEEIVCAVRTRAEENETACVLIDYLTLVRASRDRQRRDQELSDSMLTFASAAKADRMAYIVFSQLNRKCEERPDKRPIMSDLKECGGIEEYTKGPLVMMFREHMYHRDIGEGQCEKYDCVPDEMELLVRKNNNGPTGLVRAKWDGPRMKLS